ncbi:NUDIX hydrolase [Haliscomenobacter hydrossis]|uniref:NUDIX hydrolase n=1 Tax=Haliscomenobacter hydrossis (strain ATCC 27775 / DSM 1100 / LMG 10767 / O) TaxID=760192 RepID=F4L4E6_HALH1|nr:CoA pyrophosphatase [Haliscomenobacter hydrossis]AEE51815.1 NUDIX hydrolase [Haliscomenobacter hydrossis DSM 1100]
MDLAFIHHLEQSLQQPLPGQIAQIKMAHPARYEGPFIPPTATLAGVLALFFPKNGQWNLVFIERVSHNARDVHKGQISFPGGRYEAGDGHSGQTALRETHEEVGVNPQDITLLGALTELYIPVSNFHVQPYVGFMEYAPVFQPQEAEVAGILEVPFDHFHDPQHVKMQDLVINPTFTLPNVPYFDLEGKKLWGATAMIVSELLEVSTRKALVSY